MKTFHRYARLGDPGHKLPWGHRLFGQGGDHAGYEIVDTSDAFAASLIRDGSIVLEDPPGPKTEDGGQKTEEQAAAPHAEAKPPVSDH